MMPVNELQAIILSVVLLFGEFIHAHIMGTIAVVLATMNRRESKHQEQIEVASQTMKNIKLTEGLQREVQDYLVDRYSDIDNQRDLDNLLSLLSPYLRFRITQHVFFNTLCRMRIVEGLPEAIEFVVSNIEILQFMSDEYIIKQGQKATQMYFLAQGSCEVIVRNQLRKDVFVRDLIPGTLFGEVALLFDCKRTASVKIKDQSTVGALSYDNFIELCTTHPEFEKRLRDDSLDYNDPWKQFQITTLKNVPYLREVPQSIIEQLHYTLQVENHEAGARVFSEGSECRQVYFVTSGTLELFVEDGREQRILDSLGPGSWIGAYTVLNASSYKFSARAKGSLSLLVLHPQALFNISNE